MIKTCKQCNESKPIILFAKTKDSYDRVKYLTVCKACKSKNVKILRQKQAKEKVISKYDPEEHAKDAFKDDPRALQEVEYGKVHKHSTHLFSRSVLDDFG